MLKSLQHLLIVRMHIFSDLEPRGHSFILKFFLNIGVICQYIFKVTVTQVYPRFLLKKNAYGISGYVWRPYKKYYIFNSKKGFCAVSNLIMYGKVPLVISKVVDRNYFYLYYYSTLFVIVSCINIKNLSCVKSLTHLETFTFLFNVILCNLVQI